MAAPITTHGYPDRLIFHDKDCRFEPDADTDPVFSPLGILGMFIHSLLYCHAFSEIPRLIDIGTSCNRDMIGEELEGDRKHDRPC